jgi:hypothetical protein
VLGEIKKEQRHVGAIPRMDESYEVDHLLVKDGGQSQNELASNQGWATAIK